MTVQRLGNSLGTDDPFTLGWKQATAVGIDTRDFKTVKQLPSGVRMAAVAGVWGDYNNLRCLFLTAEGEQLLRHTYFSEKKPGYMIPELGLSGKELQPGDEFLIEEDD